MRYCTAAIRTVIISLFVFGAESQRPKFRDDYRFEKAFNAFYKVHREAESWPKARIRCAAEGTELMVPENLDEADTVPMLITDIQAKFEGVYLGMHDLYAERVFVTLNGSRLVHSFLALLWEQKQPKHSGGRCVAMRRSGHLFVHPCHEPLPYVCKIKAQNIVFKKECDTYNLNWTKGPNETCYLAHLEPRNWFDAYTTCLSSGGHLVVINNREEAEYIRHMFKDISERRIPRNDVAFVGFNDLFQRHHYRTVHGKPIQDTGYSDWDTKCSAKETDEPSSRCGVVRRSGLLTVSDCNTPSMFFCEKLARTATRQSANKNPF